MNIRNRVRKDILDIVPCIHGARLEESAQMSGKSVEELLDFSVNLNPLGPPKKRSILTSCYSEITSYPDNRYLKFRKAAADYLNVNPVNIVPGNGSSELIRLFAQTVIEPGDMVIIPSPTFSEYELQCRLSGGIIEKIDYDDILNIDPDLYKAVFLCNPNNPTGKLLERKDVFKLSERCASNGTFLFVDEAFIELSDPGESIADTASCCDFAVVLRSLTKSFAVPGLRIGFAVASPDFADTLNNTRLHWNVNSIAARAGEILLKDCKEYIARTVEFVNKEREWLTFKLASIRGFKPIQSRANFILIDLGKFGLGSADLTERMLKHGIIIRDCTSFGLKNHIRVAVRKRKENIKLINTFSTVIKEWGKELAETEIGKVLVRGVAARSRIDCEYYPCHFEGQDCTFCFCPFYPCEDKRTGGELIKRSAGGSVWSCSGCDLIHRSDIAEKVLKELMKGTDKKNIWKKIMEPVL